MLKLMTGAVALAVMLAAGGAMAQDTAENPVVGRVNGNEIYQSDILAAYEDLPQEYKFLPVAQLHELLLEQVVDDILIEKRTEELDYGSDPEVQGRLRQSRLQILRETYFTRVVIEEVTEEKLRERYEAMKPDLPDQDQVRASHILVETEDEAKAIIDELEGGADFAELAKEKSIGPSGANGGDLDFFAKERMVAPFAEAAFALEVGETTKTPVESEFGWHVIMVTDRRVGKTPFEELQNQIFQEMSQEVIFAEIGELREGAEVERFQFDGSPIPEEEPEDAEKDDSQDE